MAFGQSKGPSATGRQVQELLQLLQNAGHADFRDARGPMGFNQQQAGGRFTADEAGELINQLQAAEHEAEQNAPAKPKKAAAKPKKATATKTTKPGADMTEAEIALRTMSTKDLVLEIRRRGGWTVTKA